LSLRKKKFGGSSRGGEKKKEPKGSLKPAVSSNRKGAEKTKTVFSYSYSTGGKASSAATHSDPGGERRKKEKKGRTKKSWGPEGKRRIYYLHRESRLQILRERERGKGARIKNRAGPSDDGEK